MEIESLCEERHNNRLQRTALRAADEPERKTARTKNDTKMPIPQLELARVKRALDRFCDQVPAAIRPELTFLYRISGNSVLLLERRPAFRNRQEFTEFEVAKFVYSPTIGGWSLRWRDANERWHRYDGFENRPHFKDVLAEVEADPTGIFFG